MQEKKDPRIKCIDGLCMICESGKGNCKTEEIVYEVICQKCKFKYFGESARNSRSRSVEHIQKSQSTKNNVSAKSFIFNHLTEHHNNENNECDDNDDEQIKFSMNVVKMTLWAGSYERQTKLNIWIR